MLKLSGAGLSAAKKVLLSDLDWSVEPGQTWAILGPNGAGKTSLVRAAMGLLPLQQGTALLDGHPLAEWKPADRAAHLGWVPQSVDSFSEQSVLDVVRTGAWHRKSGLLGRLSQVDEASVRRWIDKLQLADVQDQAYAQLSGGEKRRALTARAFVQNPAILFLDEPTAFLDLRFQWETFQWLLEWRQASSAWVAVVHDLQVAERWASHALLLKGGRRVASGPISETVTAENIQATFGMKASYSVGSDGFKRWEWTW